MKSEQGAWRSHVPCSLFGGRGGLVPHTKKLWFGDRKIDFVIGVASVGVFGGDVAEFGGADVVSACVFAAAVAIFFTFFEAVAKGVREGDADGVFGAFLVEFAPCGEAVSGRGIGIADESGWAVVGCVATVSDGGGASGQGGRDEQSEEWDVFHGDL